MFRSLVTLSTLVASALSAQTIYKYPNGYWMENIATTTGGQILQTELNPYPNLLYIDPNSYSPTPKTVYTFPSPASGLTGIATFPNNTFYVTSLNFSFAAFTAQQPQLWKVDLSAYPSKPAVVTFVTNLTSIIFPNGMTALPGTNYVLIADYFAGKVFSVNVLTGAQTVAVDNSAVNHPSNTTIGVNGVHAPGNGYLYYTNSGYNTFGRIAIDNTGKATGSPQTLLSSPQGTGATFSPDDFLVDLSNSSTSAYIADRMYNRIIYTTGTTNTFSTVAYINGSTSLVKSSWGGVYVSSTGGDFAYTSNDPSKIPVGGALSRL